MINLKLIEEMRIKIENKINKERQKCRFSKSRRKNLTFNKYDFNFLIKSNYLKNKSNRKENIKLTCIMNSSRRFSTSKKFQNQKILKKTESSKLLFKDKDRNLQNMKKINSSLLSINVNSFKNEKNDLKIEDRKLEFLEDKNFKKNNNNLKEKNFPIKSKTKNHLLTKNQKINFKLEKKNTFTNNILKNNHYNLKKTSSLFKLQNKSKKNNFYNKNDLKIQKNNSKNEKNHYSKNNEKFLKNNLSLSFESNNGDFPSLPFTMKEFPDEINPHLFFSQKYSSFEDYINFLKKNKNLKKNFNLFCFKIKDGEFFESFKIILKNNKKSDLIFFLPLAVIYFFLNCNKIVQLYLAYNIINYLFKKKMKKNQFISLEIFLEILEKETKGQNAEKIKRIPRKSIFHRSLKTNKNLGNNENDEFSEFKILKDCDETLEKKEKDNKNLSEINEKKKMELKKKFEIEKLIILENSKIEKKEIKECEDFYEKEKLFDIQNKEKSTKIYSEKLTEIQNKKIEGEKIFEIQKKFIDSEKESIKIDSSNSSEMYSDSDSSDLSEEEYGNKNPFEVRYSEFKYNFVFYKILFENPKIIDENQNVMKILNKDDILDFLMKNEN